MLKTGDWQIVKCDFCDSAYLRMIGALILVSRNLNSILVLPYCIRDLWIQILGSSLGGWNVFVDSLHAFPFSCVAHALGDLYPCHHARLWSLPATQAPRWLLHFCFLCFFLRLKLLLEFDWSGMFGSRGAGDNAVSVDFLCPSLNTL